MEGNIGWAGTREPAAENLACILGARFKAVQAGPVRGERKELERLTIVGGM